MWGDSYITGIYLVHSYEYKFEKRRLNLMDVPARDSDLLMIQNKYYLHSEIDPDADTIADMMKDESYVKYQCWVTLLLILLQESKLAKYKNLTRSSLIKELGRTELTVGNGFKLYELEHFFRKNRIQIRVYNAFNKQIYSYDPPIRDHHIKTVFALLKDRHIYRLNNNLNRLSHLSNTENDVTIFPSSNFYIRGDDAVDTNIHYTLINGMNDIMEIVKRHDNDDCRVTYHLVVRDSSLVNLFFEIRDQGADIVFKHDIGKVLNIEWSLGNVDLKIKTQLLNTNSIERSVIIDDEPTYNSMQTEFNNLQNSVFKLTYRSSYSSTNIDILNNCRTTAVVAQLLDCTLLVSSKLVEIDKSKAYTEAFTKITKKSSIQ
jgi:hypothetical protein